MLKLVYDKLPKKIFYKWVVTLIILLAAEIIATILIPTWRQYFFDGIENKSYEVFYTGLAFFGLLIATFVITQGFKRYVGQRVSLLWRTALTKVLQKKWVHNLDVEGVDNPDQRINEDTRIASELAVEVLIETLISLIIIIGLVISMESTLLFGLSMVYTGVAITIALLFKRPMINTEIQVQKKEADHRFSLAQIVMGQGDFTSKEKYKSVVTAYMEYIKVYLHYTLFHATKSNISTIIPLLVLVPMYFSGDISFGDIMGGMSEFDLIVINSTILLILYPKITKTIASYERIITFFDRINSNSKSK